jgi:hypothetical protein
VGALSVVGASRGDIHGDRVRRERSGEVRGGFIRTGRGNSLNTSGRRRRSETNGKYEKRDRLDNI